MATPSGFGPNKLFGGDFRITRLVGEGGMGAVYRAVQESTSTPRALKLMQRELVEDPQMRSRFAQEARLGSRIASDHVAQVVAAGVDTETGIPWIAMELLEGLPLDRYLDTHGPLGPGELRFLFEQLCHALGAAHAQSIVHRDLKPTNIFLSVPRVVGLAYVVKVLDFGIAKVLAEAKTTRTAAVGTPLYMAPEQYQAGAVTPAADVWALGLVAFELLTGGSYWKAARAGEATPATVMFETCMGELGPPSERAAEMGVEDQLPEGFDAWFHRCVNREPSERFASASEAFDALAPLLGPAAPPKEALRLAPETDADANANAADANADANAADTNANANAADTNADADASKRPVAAPTSTKALQVISSAGARGTEPAPLATIPEARSEGTERGLTVVATALATQSSSTPVLRNEGDSARAKRLPRLAILVAGAVAALVLALVASAGQRPEPATKSLAMMFEGGSTAAGTVVASKKPITEFQAQGSLSIHGRVAHRQVPTNGRTETYVMLELRGKEEAPAVRAPVHLALVIDRSGSMSGARLSQAKAAAIGAVERLHDGDMVSVAAFDTHVIQLVRPIVLGEVSRRHVIETIGNLATGSDTCISCGIEAGLGALGAAPELVGRMLLLSDGAANVAVRDVAGFSRIGREAQRREVSVSTIGVGIDYNERILSALSRESNGRHYYADTESSLPRIFDAETEALSNVVATGAEARIELGSDVELLALLDRAHRVEGTAVIVPLGQFSRGEQKTVLMKVALTTHEPGALPVCRVDVKQSGPLATSAGAVAGRLATVVSAEADPDDVDPTVEVRVQRSETARALVKANELFAAGQPGEADRELGAQLEQIEQQKRLWATRQRETLSSVRADLDAQSQSLRDAREQYRSAAASGPPAVAARSAPARANARMRAMEAYDMAL